MKYGLVEEQLPSISRGLTVNQLGSEVLIFCNKSQRAHCLKSSLALVFTACEEGRSFNWIQTKLGCTAQEVEALLSELQALGLLAFTTGLARRDFIKGSGLVTLGTLVSSILTPLPAQAASVETMAQGFVNPEPAQATEDYAHLPENDFLTVAEHPLSTFGADVDTASYSNVRRFLDNGKLPPPDAVRVEEMINYFSYDYPGPTDGKVFGVSAELQECPWKKEHQLLRIGVQTEKLTGDLPPRNLVFLLDVSGSMSNNNKLPLLKRALKNLVETMDQKDRVAIVVYAGSSGLVLPSTSGDQQSEIISALDQLEAGGSTNGGKGIELAYEVAVQNFSDEGINRVILATDGDFNVGTTGHGALLKLIEEKRETGVFLTVLGLGMGNIKDETMEMLADKGNGNYAYLDSIAEARKVLVKEGGATLITVAKDVKMQVEFNPQSVFAYRLIGYENRVMQDHDFKDDKKDGGEMGAGHQVTVLYELIPPGDLESGDGLRYQEARKNKEGHETELAFLKVRSKAPEENESQERRFVISSELGPAPSPDFQFASAVAGFGMLLRQSKHKGQTSYDWVYETAQASVGEDPGGYRAEFLDLVEKAQSLQ